MRRAPESGHKRENSRRGHHVRQRLAAQLSEAGMDVEIETLQLDDDDECVVVVTNHLLLIMVLMLLMRCRED